MSKSRRRETESESERTGRAANAQTKLKGTVNTITSREKQITKHLWLTALYTLHCPQDAVLAERGGGALAVRLDAVGRVRVPLLRGIVHLGVIRVRVRVS